MAQVLKYLSWDDNDGAPGDNPLFPKKLRCIISGASGCGKTLLATNMILQQWVKFKKIYIVSGSMFQPIYQVLKHGMENKIPLHIIHNIFEQKQDVIKSGRDISEVCELLGRDIANDRRSGAYAPWAIDKKLDIDIETYENPEDLPLMDQIPRDSLVLFDDLMTSKLGKKRAEDLFMKGRPLGINIIFITQSYYELPRRTIRENANFLVLFKQNVKTIDHLFRDCVDPDMSKKEFLKFANTVWLKSKHEFITIDKSSEVGEGKYRQGFSNIYIPTTTLPN